MDGVTYTTSQTVGDGTVANVGSALTFNETGLNGGITYYYTIYSYNGIGETINYLSSNPLQGYQSTISTDVTGPAISNLAYPSLANINSSIVIEAAVTDASGINRVDLFYRISGFSSFTQIQMTMKSLNNYEGNIPNTSVTANGLEFYIQAEDNIQNLSSGDINYIKVSIPNGITNPVAQYNGNTLSSYRIFSIPIQLDNPSPSAFLTNNPELSQYDQLQYRWYAIENNDLREYPNIGNVLAGKGFLFLCNISDFKFNTGSGKSIISTIPFEIGLPQGWSLIGNPFNFNIPYDSLAVSAGTFELRSFKGDWQPNTTGLVTWEGYAIYMSQAGNFIIKPGVGGLSKPSNYFNIENNDNTKWLIQIIAEDDYTKDRFNFIGQDDSTNSLKNEFNLHEAPRIGNQVSLTFDPEYKHTTDIRELSDEGHSWDLVFRTNPESKNLSLKFAGVESIPVDFDIFLIDKITGNAYNLHNYNNLVFLSANITRKDFLLVTGSKEYLTALNLAVQLYPSEYVLYQNFPNPFNSVTQITYSIPGDEKVELTVYDVIGQRITILVNEFKQKGTYNIIWNADLLASGLYFYELKAGTFNNIKCSGPNAKFFIRYQISISPYFLRFSS